MDDACSIPSFLAIHMVRYMPSRVQALNHVPLKIVPFSTSGEEVELNNCGAYVSAFHCRIHPRTTATNFVVVRLRTMQ